MSEQGSPPQGDAGDDRHELLVYAMRSCPGWGAAHSLVKRIHAEGIGGLDVRLVDLSAHDAPVPEFVVASPIWALNGKRLSLGNPDPDWLLARIASLEEGN